jgi:DNA-binding transcriptional LysR family regulator
LARIRLHQLEGLFYTGVTGGYTSAARAMPYPITEPAVHQQVRKLERAIGVRLVETVPGRRIALTPAGRTIHEFVAPFFRGLEGAIDRARGGEATRISIALDGAIGCELLSSAIPRLRASRRDLSFHLVDSDSNGVARAVASGNADLGLGILGLARELEEQPLVNVRVALCVPVKHPLARRRGPLAPAALRGVPLCAYDRTQPGRSILESAFAAAGLDLTVAAEASSAESLLALVRAGVAPAFVPVFAPTGERSRRSPPASGFRVFDVTGLVGRDPVRYGLLRRRGASPSTLVTELRGFLAEAAARLEPGALPGGSSQ